ncbi:MAG: hypothetical protein IKD69_01610 [Solobacterium sp.]|jgi:hypothetical protein|nr:hypothetical protein [Solobacterium sp.]
MKYAEIMPPKRKPRDQLEGKKFNKLTVIRYVGTKNNHAVWECKCDCGNIVNVRAAYLKNGHTKSCGCIYSVNEVRHYIDGTCIERILTGVPANNTSGVKGVHYAKATGKWVAQITYSRKTHHLGSFDTLEEAAAARRAAEEIYYRPVLEKYEAIKAEESRKAREAQFAK